MHSVDDGLRQLGDTYTDLSLPDRVARLEVQADELVATWPDDWRTWYARGLVLLRQHWKLAGDSFWRALTLDNTQSAVWLSMGEVRTLAGDFQGALDAATRACELEPSPKALLAHADALCLVDDLPGANRAYARALEAYPGWPNALYHSAALRFRQGRWKDGWLAYRERWNTSGFYESANLECRPPRPARPMFLGQVARDRLVVWAEQGIGDIIWSSRWLNVLLHRYPGVVTLRVPRSLVQYMRRNYGMQCLVQGADDPWPDHDYQTSLMDLPAALECWEAPEPRHRAPRPVDWGATKTVGLVWAGSPGFRFDHLRSTTLEHWRPLWSQTGVRYVSLQLGADVTGTPVEPMAPVMDYADTANLVAHMDLVVGVDTGVTHLAAALGVPTVLVLGKKVDWRWRTPTTWYKSLHMLGVGIEPTWEVIPEGFSLAAANFAIRASSCSPVEKAHHHENVGDD